MKKIYLFILFSVVLSLFSFAGSTFTIDTTLVIRQTCDQAHNGEITVAPSGGIAPIMYTIDYGATWQSSPHFTGLGEGIYDVIAEDATGDDATITVIFPMGASLEVNLTTTPTSCFNAWDGTLTINPVNETPPFTYRLNGGTFFDSAFTSNTFAPVVITNLSPDLYWIEITDALGCINSVSGGITITVPHGDSARATANVTPASCMGSSDATAGFSFDTGVGPWTIYNLAWGTVEVTGNPDDLVSFPTPGNYILDFYSQNGCVGQVEVIIPDGPYVETPIVELANQQLNITNPQSGVIYTWQQLNGTWEDVAPAANGNSYIGSPGNQYRAKATIASCEVYSAASVFARPSTINPYGVATYPNPTTDVLRLTELKLADGWQTAEIINAQGAVALPVNDIRNKTTAIVNVAGIGAGIYIVKLTAADGKTTTLRFMKQ